MDCLHIRWLFHSAQLRSPTDSVSLNLSQRWVNLKTENGRVQIMTSSNTVISSTENDKQAQVHDNSTSSKTSLISTGSNLNSLNMLLFDSLSSLFSRLSPCSTLFFPSLSFSSSSFCAAIPFALASLSSCTFSTILVNRARAFAGPCSSIRNSSRYSNVRALTFSLASGWRYFLNWLYTFRRCSMSNFAYVMASVGSGLCSHSFGLSWNWDLMDAFRFSSSTVVTENVRNRVFRPTGIVVSIPFCSLKKSWK
mmetsp:Transcript_906/g.2298  ORF Transcript_906/g.2298 Transcript_906/m.2298 type:complete len:252 (-) Transcript_906:496-1251(-)